jgi:hypothetical protein
MKITLIIIFFILMAILILDPFDKGDGGMDGWE